MFNPTQLVLGAASAAILVSGQVTQTVIISLKSETVASMVTTIFKVTVGQFYSPDNLIVHSGDIVEQVNDLLPAYGIRQDARRRRDGTMDVYH